MSIIRERIFSASPPDMSAVADAGARALIARLLERDPQARVQSAAELVGAIDELLAGARTTPMSAAVSDAGNATASVLTPPVGERPAATAGTIRWIAGIALVAAALGAGAFVVVMHPREASPTKVVPAETTIPSASDGLTESGAPAPSAEASGDPAASDSAESTAAPKASGHAGPHGKPQRRAPRRTGPGGINLPNVPPPEKWFK